MREKWSTVIVFLFFLFFEGASLLVFGNHRPSGRSAAVCGPHHWSGRSASWARSDGNAARAGATLGSASSAGPGRPISPELKTCSVRLGQTTTSGRSAPSSVSPSRPKTSPAVCSARSSGLTTTSLHFRSAAIAGSGLRRSPPPKMRSWSARHCTSPEARNRSHHRIPSINQRHRHQAEHSTRRVLGWGGG